MADSGKTHTRRPRDDPPCDDPPHDDPPPDDSPVDKEPPPPQLSPGRLETLAMQVTQSILKQLGNLAPASESTGAGKAGTSSSGGPSSSVSGGMFWVAIHTCNSHFNIHNLLSHYPRTMVMKKLSHGCCLPTWGWYTYKGCRKQWAYIAKLMCQKASSIMPTISASGLTCIDIRLMG